MTLPTTFKFSKMLILLSNGGDPEVFAAPCGLTARTFDLNGEVRELPIINQEWTDRITGFLSCKLSGTGLLDAGSFDVWNDWLLGRQQKNVQLHLQGLGTYEGAFVLGTFGLHGSYGERITVNVSMESSGTVGWTAE